MLFNDMQLRPNLYDSRPRNFSLSMACGAKILICSLLFAIAVSVACHIQYNSVQGSDKVKPYATGPKISDSKLKVETVFNNKEELEAPVTGMAFLGPDDILVLEKNKGTVQRITHGNLDNRPLLKVNVGTQVEWGMLSIAVSKNIEKKYVFIYYTESSDKDGQDILGNRLYRYEFKDNRLENPVLLLELPAKSLDGSPNFHVAGKVVIGPDKNVYLSIGDVGGRNGKSQNNRTGDEPDGTSGILRMTTEGTSVGDGILGQSDILRLYYAYGIRNSFGFDFDPVKGNIWDTENGFENNDEINLVFPGFNSGWKKLTGIAPKGFSFAKSR